MKARWTTTMQEAYDVFADTRYSNVSPLPHGHLLTLGYTCAVCSRVFKDGDKVLYPEDDYIIHEHCK